MTGIAIYGVIVAALLWSVYRAPVVALAPVLCMFGLEQWAQAMIPFFSQFHTLNNLLAGALVLLGLLLMFFRGRDISLDYSPAGWLTLLLYFYGFTSLLWAPNPHTGLHIWSTCLPYIVTILVLAPLLLNSVPDTRRMCWSTLLLGAPLVVLVLVFADWEGRGIVLAGSDHVGNPLALSQMAGYVAFAAIFLSAAKAAVLYRALRWLLVAACLMLIVKSGSRGQFFGVLFVSASLLMFTLPSKGIRGAFWGTAGLGALLVLGGWALATFSETSRWDSATMKAASSSRWDAAFTMLGHWYTTPEVFFFGLGNSAAFHYIGYYSHVVPLDILAEEGLIGFGLFLAIVYLAMRSLIRAYNLVKYDEVNRGVLLTLACWFFYELFLALKQGSMLGSFLLFLFAALLNKYERTVVTGRMADPITLSAPRRGHDGSSRLRAGEGQNASLPPVRWG